MTRCPPLLSRRALRATLLALCALVPFAASPALAQTNGELGGVRTFPEQARRGTLTVLSTVDAQIDGNPVRMAPGMRLFSPQNSLVMLHSVIGKQYTVNYRMETSTGMLHTAWILTAAEIALPRAGGGVQRNFRFESDTTPR
ncbi:hypothetical protein [Simplicispira hankyongi]|uniref:Uncharacterized protein n=1 Tax=Simplicispira hankyongi TaxID=2315688 RepID=A0A398C7S5_9BURK|nr:hypothetical protein [Simplicispira hankyongi]RID98334.1 hypothetical protein D3F03_08805 [Simplicispira hankyongi]